MNRLTNFEEPDRRVERNFLLMKMLPKESERYKQLFQMMRDDVDTENKVEDKAEDEE